MVSPRARQNSQPPPVEPSPLIGRKVTLTLEKPGKTAYLRLPPEFGDGVVPSVFGSVSPNVQVGEAVEAFMLTDAKGEPQASLTLPMLVWGEVRFLEVTSETDMGVFVDWGLPKELLVPKREQPVRMRIGSRYPIALQLDRQGRLLGTGNVAELLHREPASFTIDQWVTGEAWRNDPNIGLFVILAGKWVGLLPKTEPHRQARGQESEYRINQIQPDGKLELSLRGPGAVELPGDVELVYDTLVNRRGLHVGDDTTPEQVREVFGISKKAFKRALGVLFKAGRVEFDAHGFARVIK
jgi:uncharacterized protein